MQVEISNFIENFVNAVDFQNAANITADTKLATLPEWDSLAALGVIVMFDMEYGVTINGDHLKNAATVKDLHSLLMVNA